MFAKPEPNIEEIRIFRIKFRVRDAEPIKLHTYSDNLIEPHTVRIEYLDTQRYNLDLNVDGYRVLKNGRGMSHSRHFFSEDSIPAWLATEVVERAPEWWRA